MVRHMNKEYWGWGGGRETETGFWVFSQLTSGGKQSDGAVTSLWSTPVLYKFVLEAEIGPRGTSIGVKGWRPRSVKRWPCHCMVSGAQSWVLGNFPLSQLSDGNIFPEQFRAEVDPFFPILLRGSAFLDNSWKSLPPLLRFQCVPPDPYTEVFILRM